MPTAVRTVLALVALGGGSLLAACAPPPEPTAAPSSAKPHFYDLSHKIPMFAPLDGDVTKADLQKPYKDSQPVASFGFQGVRVPKDPFKTRVGQYNWAWFYFDEHYGTHVDSTDHYQNTPETLTVDRPDGRSVDEYTMDDVVGPVVLIDIADRVSAELAKNNGEPSPDTSVTNFGPGGATLTVDDLTAIADQIVDDAWVVVRTGWDKFFVGTPPADPFMHPYVNGLNYPGFDAATMDKLIEIEESKGVHINGLVMDNFTIDSGASGKGSDGDPFGDGWAAHNKGLQRGWKFVENAANLGQLVGKEGCQLIVAAPKIISASGSPVRLLAMCKS